MSITHEVAEALAVDATSPQDQEAPGVPPEATADIYTRYVTALSHLRDPVFQQPAALEIFEHIAAGRDVVVSGPNSSCLDACVSIPALCHKNLVVLLVPNMDTLRRHKRKLTDLKLSVASFDLAPSKADKRGVWESLDREEVDVLLVSPGRLASRRFRDRLAHREISLLVVDQAHLMSPWSHRFQPSYRQVGRFIASLSSIPKIAQVWSLQGRVGHDVQRVLQLKTPYMGRFPVAGDAVPTMDVRIVSADEQRQMAVREFIDRHGGQGIIHTTSLKYLFDTKQYLETMGEEVAVVRPGMDEFSIQKIRQSFESGTIRIVLCLGHFIATLDEVPGLEFLIYNGMPESLEHLALEILAVDSAHPLGVRIISSERDFYHHRFSIDKSYPDSLVLRACFQGAKDVLGLKKVTTEEALRSHIKVATPFPEDDIRQCLVVMLREGMLEHVMDTESEQMCVQLAASSDEESDFWHEYPLRKIDHVARLEKMRDFLASDGEKSSQLRTLLKI